MEMIYLGKELYTVLDMEDFARILEDKLGNEAADLFRGYVQDARFDQDSCPGECDRIYDLQKEYEDGINEALDELCEMDCSGEDQKHLIAAERILGRLL